MSKAPVRAVETSLSILDVLGEAGPCGVTTVADRLGRPKATVYYHLKTLEAGGYVRQVRRGYDLGYRPLELGGLLRARQPSVRTIQPLLKALARETNEVAVHAVEADGHAVLVGVERPETPRAEVEITLGARLDFHCSAVGKALLAGMSHRDRAAALADAEFTARTSKTITSRSALREHLQRIEGNTLFDRGERSGETRGVAAPVSGASGMVPTAIGVVGPASRLYGDRLDEELPHLVAQCADRIEYELVEG